MGVKQNKFLSVSQVSKIIGLSRTHVLRLIQNGQIPAEKVGRSYIVPESGLPGIYRPLTDKEQQKIHEAVDKTFREYGEVIRKLGRTS
jgi:excisionase family DNA binding protein